MGPSAHSSLEIKPTQANPIARAQTLSTQRERVSRADGIPNDLPFDSQTYGVAKTRAERRAAFRLVYQQYVTSGLIDRNRYGLRVTPFHLLPTTTIFTAHLGGELRCTATVVEDGELGLPMDVVYRDELDSMRQQGLRLGEVTCLAMTPGMDRRTFLKVFLRLNQLLAQYSRAGGMHGLVIAVHPRHVGYYRRSLGFRQCGELRTYPSVRNHPAVACYVNFAEFDRERPPCHGPIFGTKLPEWQLQQHRFETDDIEYLRKVARYAGECAPLAVA